MEAPNRSFRSKPFFMMGAGLIAGLAWPLLHHQTLWLPGLLISALGFGDWLFPRRLAPLWHSLETAGKAVAHYNGMLLMTLVYFLIITPIGLFIQWRSGQKSSASPARSFYEAPDDREMDHMRRMF